MRPDLKARLDSVNKPYNIFTDVVEDAAAYKDIYEVMDLQKDLVEVLDQVTPILNIKG